MQRRPLEIPVPPEKSWASVAVEFQTTGPVLLGLYLGSERILQLCGIPPSGRKFAVLDLRMDRNRLDELRLLATLTVTAAGRPSLNGGRYVELPLDRNAETIAPDVVWENADVTSVHVLA